MTEALAQIAALIGGESGIAVKPAQFKSLEAAIARIDSGLDPDGFLAELGDGARRPRLLGSLINEITVQETYFFREQSELMALDWHGLLAAARARGDSLIRIWVPACATGDEAYTLAMLAIDALGTRTPPIRILGTDISSGAVDAACEGSYSPRSVSAIPPELLERYFQSQDTRQVVGPELSSLVQFRLHNLVSDSYPPAGETPFDLIACRNVLIYFGPDTVERVVRGLESALRPGGELILGAADRLTGSAVRLAAAPAKPVDDRGHREASEKRRFRRPLGLAPGDTPAEPVQPPPLPDHPRRRQSDRIEEAMWAADAGNLAETLEIAAGVLEGDPLSSDALFVRGIAQLGLGDPKAAITSLRRALYVDPGFGLAAYELGRAHEAAGEPEPAQQAYLRALRTLGKRDGLHSVILDQVDRADVEAACRMRLAWHRAPSPA